jgi:hypothetical protein
MDKIRKLSEKGHILGIIVVVAGVGYDAVWTDKEWMM